jgi:hypothetical protein
MITESNNERLTSVEGGTQPIDQFCQTWNHR